MTRYATRGGKSVQSAMRRRKDDASGRFLVRIARPTSG
jgi:hypothetical protein